MELKKEWEEFKRRREAENLTASTTIKVCNSAIQLRYSHLLLPTPLMLTALSLSIKQGLYQCRIDLTEPLRRGPVVRSIGVTNSVDTTLTDKARP